MIRLKSDRLHRISTAIGAKLLISDRHIVRGDWLGPPTICISFDCDFKEDMQLLTRITELMNGSDIAASFALTGINIVVFPETIDTLLGSKFEILNHTFTHPADFRDLSENKMLREILDFQRYMRDSHGYNPKGFRTPHGLRKFSPKLFEILKKTELYDSSLLGYGIGSLNGVLELPMTPCPHHPQLAFDSYHHFRFPLITCSEELMLKLWMFLLNKHSLINFFLDPIDFEPKNRIAMLRTMITSAKKAGFDFSLLSDVVKRWQTQIRRHPGRCQKR